MTIDGGGQTPGAQFRRTARGQVTASDASSFSDPRIGPGALLIGDSHQLLFNLAGCGDGDRTTVDGAEVEPLAVPGVVKRPGPSQAPCSASSLTTASATRRIKSPLARADRGHGAGDSSVGRRPPCHAGACRDPQARTRRLSGVLRCNRAPASSPWR